MKKHILFLAAHLIFCSSHAMKKNNDQEKKDNFITKLVKTFSFTSSNNNDDDVENDEHQKTYQRTVTMRKLSKNNKKEDKEESPNNTNIKIIEENEEENCVSKKDFLNGKNLFRCTNSKNGFSDNIQEYILSIPNDDKELKEPIELTEEDLKKLTEEEIKKYHLKCYLNENKSKLITVKHFSTFDDEGKFLVKKIVIKKAPKIGDINFFELEYDELTKQKNVYKKNSFSEEKEQMDPNSMDSELNLFLNAHIKQPKKD